MVGEGEGADQIKSAGHATRVIVWAYFLSTFEMMALPPPPIGNQHIDLYIYVIRS